MASSSGRRAPTERLPAAWGKGGHIRSHTLEVSLINTQISACSWVDLDAARSWETISTLSRLALSN